MRVVASVVGLAVALAGCSYGLDKRYGLNPVLDPAAVVVSSQNRQLILDAFARDARLTPDVSGYWYEVSKAGFNFIDDECRTYFHQLFFLNRDRERIKGGLGATSAATAAILGVTGATTTTMTIVAQAFGLSIAGTDLLAGAYLYQLPPSTTEGFVKEMQLAYREGAATRAVLIDSAPAAYHAIQDYLQLCLPPTIEAKLAEHIATARATPDPASNSRSASFGINLVAGPTMSRQELRASAGATAAPTLGPTTGRSVVVVTPGTRAKAPPAKGSEKAKGTEIVKQPEQLDGSVTPQERQLKVADLEKIEDLLCLPHDGKFVARTRDGIRIFQQALRTEPGAVTGQIDGEDLKLLVRRMGPNGAGAACPRDPNSGVTLYANFFERTTYTTQDSIKQLQTRLNAVQNSGPPIATISGVFDAATRDKIKAVRTAKNIVETGQDLNRQMTSAFALSLVGSP